MNPCFICATLLFQSPRAKIVIVTLQTEPLVICTIQVFQCKYRCEFYHSLDTNHGNTVWDNYWKISRSFSENVQFPGWTDWFTLLLWTTVNIRISERWMPPIRATYFRKLYTYCCRSHWLVPSIPLAPYIAKRTGLWHHN